MSEQKRIYIIAGGTVNHVAPHFALAAPAYGTVGAQITEGLLRLWMDDGTRRDSLAGKYLLVPIFTRMAEAADHKISLDFVTLSNGRHTRREVLADIGLDHIETNEDLSKLVDYLMAREDTRGIVMAAAVADWEPDCLEDMDSGAVSGRFGKDQPRLKTRRDKEPGPRRYKLDLHPAVKIIGRIRRGEKARKDIFLVTFKTTAGLDAQGTYAAGLEALKRSSSNLVLANDVQNKHNVVVTPEEFPYYGASRKDAIETLCEMVRDRVQLTFTRTTVREGNRAYIRNLHRKRAIPQNFVPVLEHLIKRGAFKTLPWADTTTGHFGCVVEGMDFTRISSVRKENHNRVLTKGAAKIFGTDEDGKIVAEGARPSVGEHTQSAIYQALGDKVHSIVHFHSPLWKESILIADQFIPPGGSKSTLWMQPLIEHQRRGGTVVHLSSEMEGSCSLDPDLLAKCGIKPTPQPEEVIPVRPQKAFECGSNECAENTVAGIREVEPGIWVTHLDAHGPNIAFHRDVPAEKVIAFIEKHWNLADKTGGVL